MQTHPKALGLLCVLAVALCVRLGYLFLYLNSSCNGLLLGDDVYYREWALRIRDGDWPGQGPFEQGPLYAYLLALPLLAGLPEPVILFLQMLTGVAVSVLVYLCGRELFEERIATAAGVLTALYGPLPFYECMFMKTFLSPLFVILTLYFGLRYARTSKWWWACLSGATIGLACLLRESYVLLLLPLALWVWARAEVGLRTRSGHLLALAASFGLVLMPSAVRNYLVAGELVLVTTGGGEVMYIAHGPEADGFWHSRPVGAAKVNPRQEHQAYRDEAERRTGRKLTAAGSSRFWYGEAFGAVAANPGRFLVLTAKRAANLFNDLDFPDSSDYQTWRQFIPLLYLLPSFGWIVAFGMLGIGVCALDWKRHGLAIGLIAMIVLSVLLTYPFGRFRLGMMPLWILYATAGFFQWLSWWRSNTRRQRLLAVTSTVACLAVTIVAFRPPPGAEIAYSPAARQFWRNVVSTQVHARKKAAQLQTVPSPSAEVHSQLGRQLIIAGRRYEGIREHRLALDLAPRNARLRVAFAEDLLAIGDEAEALDLIEETLRLDPSYGSAVANKMLLYMVRTRPDVLRQHLPQLLDIAEQMCQATHRNDPELLYTLAGLYARADRPRDAIRTAEQALPLARKRGNEPLVAVLQGLIDLCRGKLREAGPSGQGSS